MQSRNPLWDNLPRLAFFLIALIIVAADQASKAWIRGHVPLAHAMLDTGFFQITHIRNTGAAFGIFPQHSAALAVLASLGGFLILLSSLYLPRHIPLLAAYPAQLALGLVLGGTAGNLIDRLRFGSVTDFIHFSFWPAFNVADSAVTVGALWLAFLFFRQFLAENRDG
jgi:signal peptidase II